MLLDYASRAEWSPALAAYPEPWLKGLHLAMLGGTAEVWRAGEGLVVLRGEDDLWHVEVFTPGANPALVRQPGRLIVWDETPELPTTFERLQFRQDLSKVLLTGHHEPAYQPSDREQVINLHARVHAGTLEGFFLTAPPTLARCKAALAQVLDESLAFASFVIREGETILGSLIAVEGERPDEAVLFDLVVTPEGRQRGIGRRLVRAWQQALRDRGYKTTSFLTMGHNQAVLKLFTPEEILEVDSTKGGAHDGRRPA